MSAQPPSNFVPALRPPPGVTSNPQHPDNIVGLTNVTIIVGLVLVNAFFFLRSYARIFLKRIFTFEDVLVTISWAGTVAYCGIIRAGVMAHHGGEHGWDITKDQAHQAAYWFNVAAIEYGVMIGMVKLSVLWLYRRVFSPNKGSKFDITCVALIVMVIGFYGSTSIVKIWQCLPREKIWNKAVPGKCLQLKLILNISGAFNMVTDYLILLLPIQAVRSLQVSRTKRLLIVLAFTFGLCAPVFATIGFVVRVRTSGNPDTTWNQPGILLWGAGELVSSNLCVCFPELTFLLCKKRRTRMKMGKDAQHYPTASQIERQSANNNTGPKSHPYFTKSLMGTVMMSKNEDRAYIELHEVAGAAHTPSTIS